MQAPFVYDASLRFVQGAELGEGTFGVVRRVWDSQLYVERALKTFKPEDDGDVAECALREMAFQSFLTDCRAPNVVPFLDVMLGEGAGVAMLMPLMHNDLADDIESQKVCGWPQGRPIMADVLRAVAFLHSFSPPLMHRDLKPENVLRDVTGKAYVTDFGFTRFCKDAPPFDDARFSRGSNQRATATYSAPEMLRHGVPHGPLVDVWAAGVIAIELVQGSRLSAQTDRTARKQLRRRRAQITDPALQNLAGGMLSEDVNSRWTASACLSVCCGAEEGRSWSHGAFCHASPEVVHREPAHPSEVEHAVAEGMRRLEYSSPQTFYAACAYVMEAFGWEGFQNTPLHELCFCASVAAGKLYEHEYFNLRDVRERAPKECTDLDQKLIFFQKSLLQKRRGRLLLPFASSNSRFSEISFEAAKAGRGARAGRRDKRPDTPAPTSGAMGEQEVLAVSADEDVVLEATTGETSGASLAEIEPTGSASV